MKQPKFMKNSAEKVGNNQDLLTEILLRLPTKSLIKFECVSKQWLSLISDPQFGLSHTRRHHHHGFLEPTALLLSREYSTSPEFDVVPLKHHSEVPFFGYVDAPCIKMLQSCNGLFLCEAFDDNDDEVENVSRYLICNPTTKKFKMLLSFPSNPRNDYEVYVSLAFDPLKSPHYKIIAVRGVSDESYDIDIYSSETDYWAVTGIRFQVDSEACIVFENAVFCNGIIYWNSYGNESLCFDVGKQCLRKMPMPTPPIRNDQLEIYRYFGETRGTLYLAKTYHGFIALELDVHQMANDCSHWFLKHRLNLGDAVKAFPELNLGCHPFCPGFSGACFVRSEKEDQAKVVVWADGKIICYDFNDGAWKMVCDPGPGAKIGTCFPDNSIHLHEGRFLAYKYFENLSSI